MVALPDNLAVGADYGLTVLSSASSHADRFALFILSTKASASSPTADSRRPACRDSS